MRDVTIYYRNNPSVLFYEGCNQILSIEHMNQMKNIRLTWDPYGGRLAGLRSDDDDRTQGIREYSCTMDGAKNQPATPLWDAEYARGEAPRRVWDEVTPILNPRWDGKNPDPTPADGVKAVNTTSKYVTGGYFAVASDYHRKIGLNNGKGDFIGDYIKNGHLDVGYFRLQSSEDMVLENLAKYWARYSRSPFVQDPATSQAKGVMIGGAKIIWSDSVTDGRMRDMEVARVSGALDGARLPKEVFYGLQVAQNTQPEVYVVGHWNYPAGTVKRVYVVSNTAKVKLEVLDPSGNVIKDYGFGRNDFVPPKDDQVNHYCYAFDNVAFQPGTIKATGYDAKGQVVATEQKSTAGQPVALKMTPVLGPSGKFFADGSDIAMFDIEVLDANGNRCPTFEDSVDFFCSGEGIFLGGYNSGIRYSTNDKHLTTGYHFNIEAGINRVFVRSTRKAGAFTLKVTRLGLTPDSATITSTPVTVQGGLMTQTPQLYTVALGAEPAPAKAEGFAGDLGTGSASTAIAPPPAPATAPGPAAAATGKLITDFAYSGANNDAEVVENAQKGSKVYKDSDITFGDLPSYLLGAEYIRPYLSDAGETSSTDQYQFDLTASSYVYLLIDSANDMPASNDNDTYKWQKLPGTVALNGRTMTIYKSRLMQAKDNVYLAANGHGAEKFDPKSNMYLVMVTPATPAATPQPQPAAPAPAPSIPSGMTVTASSSDKKNPPEMAIDGNPKTHWSAGREKGPQWLKIDLGKTWNLTGYAIEWHRGEKHTYQYLIEVSDDDKTYQVSVDQQANSAMGNTNDTVAVGKASRGRYIRLTIKEGTHPEIDEFHINGAPVPGVK
jgi:beta-galactosidase